MAFFSVLDRVFWPNRLKFPPPFPGAKVCIGGGAGFIG
jgi:hypothetical protein